MPNYEFAKYEVRDRVAWVTLSRPEVTNALYAKRTVSCPASGWG